jgi:hypothetical protein
MQKMKVPCYSVFAQCICFVFSPGMSKAGWLKRKIFRAGQRKRDKFSQGPA